MQLAYNETIAGSNPAAGTLFDPGMLHGRAASLHGAGRRFDSFPGDCGCSSMVERQVVTLEAPVQLRSVTPRKRTGAGDPGLTVNQVLC